MAEQSAEQSEITSLMTPAAAVFPLDINVGEVIDRLGKIIKHEFVTYGFIVDTNKILKGVVTMRDLLFSDRSTPIANVMLTDPFYFNSKSTLLEAMKASLTRHFPVYPVCDGEGHLLGEVRGGKLFEVQAIELSAQAGSMVGVEKEERLTTPWPKSFKFRHPWLQLNLLTAFTAGAVVSTFQGTIDRFVILATFLPILAGQSGNTGCQALAVTLRGLTLGDSEKLSKKNLIFKEFFLGLLNGFFVGFVAGAAMYFLAYTQGSENPAILGCIVWVAMVASCAISGLSGAVIPLILKRLGADPATASSIFLTTATDVCSMGMLLGLASLLLL